MADIKWSKSRIKIFANCPRAYQYNYIDKIPQKEVEALSKGNKLHDVFEYFYETKNIQSAVAKANLDNDFILKYEEHINNFLDFYNTYKLTPIETEKRYEIDNYVGIIDRLDIIDGKFAIIDYKTSKGDSLSNYYDELLFYAFLLQKIKNIKIEKIGIYFSTNNKLIIEDITQEQIDKNIEGINIEIELYEEMIEAKQFPKTHNNCFWCGFREHCNKDN